MACGGNKIMQTTIQLVLIFLLFSLFKNNLYTRGCFKLSQHYNFCSKSTLSKHANTLYKHANKETWTSSVIIECCWEKVLLYEKSSFN